MTQLQKKETDIEDIQEENSPLKTEEIISINTPPDSYIPDKIGDGITVDTLQQKRMDDIDNSKVQSFI